MMAQGRKLMAAVKMPQRVLTAFDGLLGGMGQSLVVVATTIDDAGQELIHNVKPDTDLDTLAMMLNQTMSTAQKAYGDFGAEVINALKPFGKAVDEVVKVVPEFPTNGDKVSGKVSNAMMKEFVVPFAEGVERLKGFTHDFDKLPLEQKQKMLREINTGLDAGVLEQMDKLKLPKMDIDKVTAGVLNLLPPDMGDQARSIRRWTALLPRQNLNAIRSLADAVHVATATLGNANLKWGYGPEFTEGARPPPKVMPPWNQPGKATVDATGLVPKLAAAKKILGLLHHKSK